jgi:lipopolysaccharide transport system ATP-binding protein
MSDIILRAENIGKRYVLNHQAGGQSYRKFSDTLVHAAKAPLRWLQTANHEQQTANSKEDFWALKDVSFEIKQGDVVGIIGRNGAGKSTLLKILSRITEPTTGRITLNGRIASLLEVGTGFHPELTGRENIFLNGAILGMTKVEIKAKFDEIVAFAEIERFLDTPVKRYSSGMYVRLAFAVAAHLEPEILIVDEVLAVGDSQFQQKCLGKMRDVTKNEGRTVLFVSHNMDAIRTLCRRGIALEKGYIQTKGPIEEVLDKYLVSERLGENSKWLRSKPVSTPASFTEIEADLLGTQPFLVLSLAVKIVTHSAAGGVMLAFDICDSMNVPLMQAVPKDQPFFGEENGIHTIVTEVTLPPLIPGRYYISAWIGQHFSRTIEFLETVINFEVTESPCSNRSFPHSREHGFLAAQSAIKSTSHRIIP